MNAPLPAGALNAAALQNHVDASWQEHILPALVRRGDLLLTVSTAGAAPALSAALRGWLEDLGRGSGGQSDTMRVCT